MAGDTVLCLVGNLVDAPELRFPGASGAAVASFTVASTPRQLDKASGEWTDGQTLYMRCSVWRQQAENLCADDSIGRGTRVMVTGRLVQRNFEHQGQKRTVVELEVDEIGPSLKYATARVNKTSRGGGGEPSANREPAYAAGSSSDPWGAGPDTPSTDESPPPF